MTRELKFRVYAATDEGPKMIYLKPLECDNGLWFPCEEHIEEYKDDIMQFTGLKDKNGIEIYEGDIVKWDDGSNGKYWRVAVVLINPDIRFEIITNTLHPLSTPYPDTFKFGNFIYPDTHNHLYVVGNIYEHPHILK